MVTAARLGGQGLSVIFTIRKATSGICRNARPRAATISTLAPAVIPAGLLEVFRRQGLRLAPGGAAGNRPGRQHPRTADVIAHMIAHVQTGNCAQNRPGVQRKTGQASQPDHDVRTLRQPQPTEGVTTLRIP